MHWFTHDEVDGKRKRCQWMVLQMDGLLQDGWCSGHWVGAGECCEHLVSRGKVANDDLMQFEASGVVASADVVGDSVL